MPRAITALLLQLLLLTCISAALPPVVVDLRSQPLTTVLAVQVCAGLLNRDDARSPGAYTLMHDEDAGWLAALVPGAAPAPTPAADFVAACLAPPGGAAAGVLLINSTAQKAIIPNLITLAAVLGAVPLDAGSPLLPSPPPATVFDAATAWAGFSPLAATEYMFARFAANTTTLAKMNPGWDVHGSPLAPPLTLEPDLSLTDYIVKARLFNFFLLEGCINGTAEHALMERMAREGPWARPIAVLGYDDTLPIAGDVFEAETTCVSARDMGQIASTGVNNLAFFSRSPRIAAPLAQAPTPAAAAIVYNASRTYLSIVIGDGDNLAFVKSSRRAWLEQRRAACSGVSGGCFPLLWSLSPHLLELAPDMLRWFFNVSLQTGADWFVLPPSGHLYAYPSLMPPADQAAFVAATEADCVLMNTSASVAWEFVGSWGDAIASYFPRYAPRGTVTALFAVNVPYMLPVVEFSPAEFFKVLNDSIVLFRPAEWRGTSGSANPLLHPFLLSAAEMAALVNAYPAGTVAHFYVTSDGGADIQDVFDLVALLGEHVQVVDHVSLAQLALQSHQRAAAGAAAAGAVE